MSDICPIAHCRKEIGSSLILCAVHWTLVPLKYKRHTARFTNRYHVEKLTQSGVFKDLKQACIIAAQLRETGDWCEGTRFKRGLFCDPGWEPKYNADMTQSVWTCQRCNQPIIFPVRLMPVAQEASRICYAP